MMPKPQVQAKTRLGKRKRVTIAAAFRCIDGIVLSSDTQETYGGIKKQVSKLELRGVSPGQLAKIPCAAFCGATDDGHFFDMLIEKLWLAMETAGPRGLDAMIDALEDELIKQYQRFHPIYPNGIPESAILIGIWSAPNEFRLCRVDGAVVQREVFLEAVGCGDILATYLANRLLWPKTWKEQAIPIGIYMVDQAKQHVEFCGGDTQLVIIEPGGNVERYTSDQVKAETERLQKLDLFARQIVGMCMSSFVSEMQFDLLMADQLKQLKEIVVIRP